MTKEKEKKQDPTTQEPVKQDPPSAEALPPNTAPAQQTKHTVAMTTQEAPLIATIENLDEMVKRAEAEVEAIKKIKIISLRSTNEADWIVRGGNPYLQIFGTMKIASLWAINIKDMTQERQDFTDKDGQYYVVMTHGTATFRGRELSEVGTCTSRDEFFGVKNKEYKPLEDVVYENIAKASVTNFHNRVLKKILGLSPTWDDLKQAGLDRAKVKVIDQQQMSGTDEEKQKQAQVRAWLYEMHGDQHLSKLLELSPFVTKKDGKAHDGVKTYEELRGLRLTIFHEKVERVYAGWKKEMGTSGSAPAQTPTPATKPAPAPAGTKATPASTQEQEPEGEGDPQKVNTIDVNTARKAPQGKIGNVRACVGAISFDKVGKKQTEKTTIEVYQDETSDEVLVLFMWGDHREDIKVADTMIFHDVLKSEYNGQMQYNAKTVEVDIPFGK